MLRIAALLIVIGGSLVAGPASAQFGNLFGDSPPRPPADVPGGGQPSSPDYPGQRPPSDPANPAPGRGPGAQAYPGQGAYPGQAAPTYPAPPRPPSPAVEEQALPPPPGAGAPSQPYPPSQPADRGYPPPPPPVGAPGYPSQPADRGNPPQGQAPGQGATAPPAPAAADGAAPDDDTVVEKPTAHIDNKRAVFVGLDKITGRTIKFDAALGETVQFGALQVTPRTCYTRPPTEATNTDAFVEVDEVTLKGDIKRIFTVWMFASSPGLNAVDHPIYDIWLIDCAAPIETTLAQPPAQPAASLPAPAHHPATRRRPPPARDAVKPEPD